MPSARYWRLTFYRTQGSSYAQIRELAFLDAAGVDQSIGGTAYANSNGGSSWLPAYAFDKSTATGWCNTVGQFPAAIWYVHPSAVDIAAVRVYWDSNISYAPTALSDMRVAWSDDGVNWQTDSRALQITEGGIIANTSCTMALVQPQPVQTINRGLLIAASAPVISGAPGTVLQATAAAVRDTEFGGGGRIWGTTKVKGTPNLPTKARVRLLRDQDSLLAREVWSNPETGAFEFTGIDASQPFTVLAADAAGNFRAVAANRILSQP